MSNEGEKARVSGEVSRPEPLLPTVNPAAEKSEPPKPTFHPAVYVSVWIALSSSVILFNKHILDYAQFRFPIILTTWHLAFATFMTQVLARTTTLLDGRKSVKMTGRVYLRAIVPIGLFFSLSLICGNVTYLYLSVAFIQMLKATTPVAVLLATWAMGMAPVNLKVLFNVAIIVVGVVIASFGEIKFVFIGFLFQIGGIVFEATRLVMVQRLLSSAEFKMDPLVSLYYFAPVCAVMNGVTALFVEVPSLTMGHVYNVGVWTLLANAVVAFLLNVSVVFLIGKTSSLVMTLCGVLKDILLVAASMMIWQTPVTPLQFFGYSIALIGLVYYKLGGDKIREYAGQANRSWAEYGANHPAQRKSIIIGAVVLIFFLLIGSMAPSYAPESVDKVKGMLGGATAGNA
ncbi:UDP-galactofuranose transporter [Aspergillus novofumigatus IBT 16806]|uniref:TPT-domain-containing protein n=1 Tax=Aspergillus novofumigatus (strain IBT 16806) TaxID=1392255 RepID=A0A2I1BT42_ASPN1|nr:TPT-domain-containing protein [Aspergillus novofumigatus IBT 16806]PKX88522.1 TPT-domain-containing protein [Aspergillus novofumigatus IBT 16806]